MRIERAPATMGGVKTLMAVGDVPEDAKLDPVAVAVFAAGAAALGAYLLGTKTNTTLIVALLAAGIGYKYTK